MTTKTAQKTAETHLQIHHEDGTPCPYTIKVDPAILPWARLLRWYYSEQAGPYTYVKMRPDGTGDWEYLSRPPFDGPRQSLRKAALDSLLGNCGCCPPMPESVIEQIKGGAILAEALGNK